MLSNRISTRREFLATFSLAIATANSKLNSQLPARKFELGERVITKKLCDDERFSNYGDIDWDLGVILGYCWQYEEWNRNDFSQGWTYFIRFDESNYEGILVNPYLDFEHEKKLEKI